MLAVDVVTAAGELVHADEHANPDLLWAARGSGSGFFGIVTPPLAVYEAPQAIFRSAYVYPLDELDPVLRFAMDVQDRIPANVEFALLGTTPRLPEGGFAEGGTALVVAAAALCRTEDEARAGLAPLEECPVLDRAVVRQVAVPADDGQAVRRRRRARARGMAHRPDNMWTTRPDELIPAVRELFTTVPNDESHVFWWPWRAQELPDMAFSVQARLTSRRSPPGPTRATMRLCARGVSIRCAGWSPSPRGSSSPTRTSLPARTDGTSWRSTTRGSRRFVPRGPRWPLPRVPDRSMRPEMPVGTRGSQT